MSNASASSYGGNIRLCSYNVKSGLAIDHAGEVAAQNNVDILCLQEALPNGMPDQLGGLSLASSVQMSPSLGLSTYYRADRFKLLKFHNLNLPQAWYEKLQSYQGPRLQLTQFMLEATRSEFTAGNLHLPNLYARNIARRRQLIPALHAAKNYGGVSSTAVVSDTNYPFFEHTLQEAAREVGFEEVGTHHAVPTHNNRLVKSKFDRAFIYRAGLVMVGYQVLPFANSDHAPVVIDLEPVGE